MSGYILRRMILAVPLLLGLATIVFSLIHLIPGDPVEVMLGPGAGTGDIEDLRARLGLDRPLLAQYGTYLEGLAKGDLGTSLRYRDPVAGLIAERYPATLVLAAASMLLALSLAFPIGIASAMRPAGSIDRLARLASALALSLPSFWLGPLLILLFAIRLGWLPISGMDSPRSVLLPAVTLGLPLAALLTRLLRSSLLEEMGAPHLRAARSRGLSSLAATFRHALRNALAPVVTVAGLQIGSLLTGAILTETVFAWPGLGRLLVQAIAYRDYPLVQGCVLSIAGTYVLVNLATDLVHGLLDPRLGS
ncbi:MAG TPA: ABC transporter permease [Candidatus Polarisedimenticolia bacterium]|nr:ABC transporter permease [Candidatus Polarisedimenticolia bacterium]